MISERVVRYINLSGNEKTVKYSKADFKILGRTLEIMYLLYNKSSGSNSGNLRRNVSLIIEAEFDLEGSQAVGFIEAAEILYVDSNRFVVLETTRWYYPL